MRPISRDTYLQTSAEDTSCSQDAAGFIKEIGNDQHRVDSRGFLRNSMRMTLRTWHAALFAIVLLAATLPAIAQRQVYPAPEQAAADLAAALKVATAQQRRVLLDFGGDWCTDCLVLDSYFHDSSNKPILEADFVLVHINVAHLDKNLDIAGRYQVPLNKGVPALAVLSARGKLLYSQRSGEFEAMRHMESSAVTQFLLKWKPARPAQK
jgi:thioredoxin 1